jgi:hypothetical protein
MARYAVVGLPNDGTWECMVCGAIVANRQLHDTYAHADWASLPPETAPNRQAVRQVPLRQYAPTPREDTP